MSEKKEGLVKWFDNEKGFGFIDFEGVDYFVHFKSIIMDGYKHLSAGQKVIFSPYETDRGFAATDVEIV